MGNWQGFTRRALLYKAFQHKVQNLAAHQGIGGLVKRFKRAQAQNIPRIDGVGIADQPRDRSHVKLFRAVFDRGARGRARRGINGRAGVFKRVGKGQPLVATGPHLVQCRITAGTGQAVQKVGKPVQPARRHSFSICIAVRAGQHNFGRGNGLLVIMRGQADLAIGQQQTRIFAQFAVQPRIGVGQFGPCAIVEATQNNQIRPLHPRFKRAPDHDGGVGLRRIAHLALIKDGGEKIGVILRRHIRAMRCLGCQIDHRRQCLQPRSFGPKRAGARSGSPARQVFRK